MSILITGLNGTLAPHVARQLHAAGHQVIGWDRSQLDPGTATQTQITQHLDHLAPDGIIHLGMGSEHSAATMATFMAERDLPFLFTSTAMVFDASSGGPHHVHDERTAQDGYGTYKIRCEDAIFAANPSATIARIGWQIDCETPTGNNMVANLLAQANAGVIRASAEWIPATSFMTDTAAGLAGLFAFAQSGQGAGVHHLDSNAGLGLSFPQIVADLAQKLGTTWPIEVTGDYIHDQRLMPARRADTIILPDLPFAKARP